MYTHKRFYSNPERILIGQLKMKKTIKYLNGKGYEQLID